MIANGKAPLKFAGLWRFGFCAALLFGIGARLIWGSDIEYKGDESWTFNHLEIFNTTGQIPAVGMMSSARIPNPGMSIWVFLAMDSIFKINDPPALAIAIATLNVAAILLLTLFVLRCVRPTEREPWLWAVAFVSVNPMQVLLDRKIWAQSVLPIFSLGMLLGWWYRRRFWGAFSWGLIGALVGQIHLGGFFFEAAFVLFTLIFDRRSVRWPAWFVGTVIGLLPALPWAVAIFADPSHTSGYSVRNLGFAFYWLDMISGFDAILGLGADSGDFFNYPGIDGVPTHLVTLLLGLIALVIVVLLIRLAVRIWANPREIVAEFFGNNSNTALALSAAFFGYGLLLTASLRPVWPSYLVIAFPLPFLSMTWLALEPGRAPVPSAATTRRLLLMLALAQAGLTACLMTFIHEKQFINGGYGTVYRAQTHGGE